MTIGDFTRDPLLRAFGTVLHSHREAAGLSRPQLAEALGCTPQWIEAIESGKKPASEATAIDCDTYFKTPACTFQTIWGEIKKAGKHLALPPGFDGFVRSEARAVSMDCFEAQVIPGLLQSESYARALMNAGQPVEELDALVAQRIERQSIHDRDKPPRMWFVIDESALHRPVGGSQVMCEQLQHVLDTVARFPNIQVRILPYESVTWAGLDGSFTVLGFADGSEVAYHESPGAGQLIDDPGRVARTAVRFGLVMGEALPVSASLAMIKKALKEYT
jgi:DNA-binding XRE family transcriptional regulator